MLNKHDTSTGYKTLDAQYPKVNQNIVGDPDTNLAESNKQKFYDHLKAYAGPETIEEHCNLSFFYNNDNLLLGENKDSIINQILGNCIEQDSLYRNIQSSTGDDIMDIKTNFTADKDEIISLYGDYPIKLFNMWSFDLCGLDPVIDDIGFKIINLPCILGLTPSKPHITLTYYIFSHSLNDAKLYSPKKPTAFDAGLNIYWLPGGKTMPLDGCNSLEGLNEIIHRPNHIKNIRQGFISINYKFT